MPPTCGTASRSAAILSCSSSLARVTEAADSSVVFSRNSDASSTKITSSGGSSSIFSSAFAASCVKFSASSIMKTRWRPSYGFRTASRCISRICSTLMAVRRIVPLDEPPCDMMRTSAWSELPMRWHCWQSSQGFCAIADAVQFTRRAMSRASVILPICGGPASSHACAIRPVSMLRASVASALSWPTVCQLAVITLLDISTIVSYPFNGSRRMPREICLYV